jgi:hypothetical protein
LPGVFLGHYGLAFAAKRASPETSLGTLTFASQWLDELWPILLLLGVERVRIAPRVMPASDLDFVSYPISHSLLAAVGWGVLIGLVYYFARRRSRGAWIVGALVVSHWVLDLLVHGPDLPLYPGGPRVGLGAWNSVPLTWALEGLLYGGGLIVYLRSTKAKDAIGRWGLWALVAVQVALYAAGGSGPPPSASVIAWSALVLWLFIPWAAWVDRHRAR